MRLNHAVAVAMVHGPGPALKLLGEIEAQGHLSEHHRLHAVRGHLLERSGDIAGAVDSYRRAAKATASLPERNYLLQQAARLEGSLN